MTEPKWIILTLRNRSPEVVYIMADKIVAVYPNPMDDKASMGSVVVTVKEAFLVQETQAVVMDIIKNGQ